MISMDSAGKRRPPAKKAKRDAPPQIAPAIHLERNEQGFEKQVHQQMEHEQQAHAGDPLASECWKMALTRSHQSLTLCPPCRNRFCRDPRKVQLQRNGDAIVTITLCRRCVEYNIADGQLYYNFTYEQNCFDNQAQEAAVSTSYA